MGSCHIIYTICISIHALLAESDAAHFARQIHKVGISIHALLAESDLADCTKIYAVGDFYPRSPCGERPEAPVLEALSKDISIHALLAESDGGIIWWDFVGR